MYERADEQSPMVPLQQICAGTSRFATGRASECMLPLHAVADVAAIEKL